ncbi:hypothetical protein ACFOY8_12745 [Thalassospira xianhensis]|uniref:Uncharacterized protein n=1 Tax=Thalassospira xianhensis MCCC 1A02616 TaxID=1177929 RepID=A0A367UF33_9PROT|nr:hypothetical protein [Thalassospira xianhensis]RCK06283.1 hypothetical protein TH5_08685 [Thalassospira xianhensis MCCC 1A02616]
MDATIEFAVDPQCGVLAAYSDRSLDAATKLVLDHKTGKINASVGIGKVRAIDCGTVSFGMTNALTPYQSVIWARIEGDQSIALAELPLMHN